MIPNGTNAKKYALTPRSAMTPRPVFISINTLQSLTNSCEQRIEQDDAVGYDAVYGQGILAAVLQYLYVEQQHYKSICKFIEETRDTGCHDILHAVQDSVWHYETQLILLAEEMR